MKKLSILLVLSFLIFNLSAQHSKKNLFLTTTPTGLITLNDIKTVWIGSEYFITNKMSLNLNFGYIKGEESDETLTFMKPTPFLPKQLNVRTHLAFRYFIHKGWYNGINLGYNQIHYGAERETVKGWQEEDRTINLPSSGSIEGDFVALVLFTPLFLLNDLGYSGGFKPIETEVLFQHIKQERYSLQYMIGWSGTSNRFLFDIYTGIGKQWISNDLIEGERHALISGKRIPNKNHMATQYRNTSINIGIKIGWMLNYNNLDRF